MTDNNNTVTTYLEARAAWERHYWVDALAKCGYNMTELSRVSALNRPSLYRKLEGLGLSPTKLRALHEGQTRPPDPPLARLVAERVDRDFLANILKR